MSPASYQNAPPRVGVSSAIAPAVRPGESGKRDSNPRPQPWQGCALPTELFPRDGPNLTCPLTTAYRGASVCLTLPPVSQSYSGGEGDRTPDLVDAIHALSQLSYAPVILGPRKAFRREHGILPGRCRAVKRFQAVAC